MRNASTSFVGATQAPGATRIDAGIDPLRIGAGGSTVAAFSPNIDGSGDRLHLTWRNHVALDTIALRVYRLNGSFVGSRALARTGAGDQAYDWDGILNGVARVPDGRYVLQLVGTAGGHTYSAPSARPVTPSQIARYSTVIDRVPPPIISGSASGGRISPNGDGRLDRLTFALSATGGASWVMTVARLSRR